MGERAQSFTRSGSVAKVSRHAPGFTARSGSVDASRAPAHAFAFPHARAHRFPFPHALAHAFPFPFAFPHAGSLSHVAPGSAPATPPLSGAERRYVSFCESGCSAAAPTYFSGSAGPRRRRSSQARALECGLRTGTGGRTLNQGVALPGLTTWMLSAGLRA